MSVGPFRWLVSDNFALLVLREIEAEDSLWHQKKTSQTEPEKPQEPKEEQKQPTPSSAEKADDKTVQTESKPKLRFY